MHSHLLTVMPLVMSVFAMRSPSFLFLHLCGVAGSLTISQFPNPPPPTRLMGVLLACPTSPAESNGLESLAIHGRRGTPPTKSWPPRWPSWKLPRNNWRTPRHAVLPSRKPPAAIKRRRRPRQQLGGMRRPGQRQLRRRFAWWSRRNRS